MLTLHIGNKNYSSWSLRPWLALRWANLPFQEHLLRLGGDGYGASRIAAVCAVSPSGRVPALTVGAGVDALTVWDSLAITEWAADHAAEHGGDAAAIWPPAGPESAARALARCAVAEMHSGFAAMRRDLGMNIRRRRPDVTPLLPEDTLADLARFRDLVGALHERFGGPWLVGRRSAADAFYAPMATRLRTYGMPVSEAQRRWCDAIFDDPDFRAWEAAAEAEPWAIDTADALWP